MDDKVSFEVVLVRLSVQLEALVLAVVKVGVELETQTAVLKQIKDGQDNV